MSAGHESLLDIAEFDPVQVQHVLLVLLLLVLVPGQILGREDEPIVPGASLHDAQVGDGHVALADHLVAQLPSCLVRVLRLVLSAT